MSEDAASDPKGRTKYFRLIIVPTLIAGFFALLPTLYQQWREPRARLTYEATLGPEVQSADGAFRIGSAQIWNSGTKPLSVVRANIEAPAGSIQAFSVTDGHLIGARTTSSESTVVIELDSLLPGERVGASYLIKSSAAASMVPRVHVRSAEVVGDLPGRDEKGGGLSSGLLSALSVVIGLLASATVFRKKAIRVATSLSQPADKQLLIRYIAARAGVLDFASHPAVVSQELSYLGASDILLNMYLQEPALRVCCASASQAMLLVEGLQKNSRMLIIRNIEHILGASFDKEAKMLESKAVSISDGVAFRVVIDKFLDNPPLFFMGAALSSPADFPG